MFNYKVILYFLFILVLGCDKTILPSNENEVIEAILDKDNYYNLITTTQDSLIPNTWHISLQFNNVECNGMEAPMYTIVVGEELSVTITDAAFDDNLTTEDFDIESIVENESLSFSGTNEIIHYSGCDDNFQTHNLTINNVNRVYLLHDSTSNNYFKLQFIDFISPSVLFQYSILN